jgi:predicted lipid-binding transport protein (Tim44 family)
LGTRHGDERERPNPFTSTPAERAGAADPAKKIMETQPGMLVAEGDGVDFGLDRSMSIEGERAERGLIDIARVDRGFTVARFLSGAQDAFTIIVEAFAEGDRQTLGTMLSEGVYDAFASVIAEREKSGQKSSVEIHAVRRSEIIDASLENKKAFITVRFIADETNVLRDVDDNIISGDPDRVTETIDIWTFSRDTRSKDPTWYLCQTRDEDAEQDDHKTVPDGGEKAD